ncbi:MAG: TetR/AcrR family transcriptional regulator, partial [Pseudomonadota bacterium]
MGRRDWLALGLTRLAQEGAGALTVEALCLAAGKTRGSFYHHFDGHDAFVAGMLAFWRERDTEALKARASAVTDATDRYKTLGDSAVALKTREEVAIRQFAQSNPVAGATVREVDEDRMAFLASIWAGRGAPEATARTIAEIEYGAFIGLLLLYPDADAER